MMDKISLLRPHLGLSKSGLISKVVLILTIEHSKCHTISKTLFHTFFATILLLCSRFLKYAVEWQTV